ncbi:MAG TPA: transcription antitermination factor NusB [Acidobacteriaceae bacterium]
MNKKPSQSPTRPRAPLSARPPRAPANNPPAKPAPISPARAAAFEILLRVGSSDAHSDDLLHSPRVNALSSDDRNLTTALVMGVLRWQIALDARIAKLLSRPDQRLAEPVAIALRLGAFQLLHMDRIPPHAALNESVELCRAAAHPHAAGMVNAILREIARQSPTNQTAPQTAARRTPLFESPAAFAQRLGHPAWLVERWVANHGRDAALAICDYDQHEAQREPDAAKLFPAPPDSLPHIDDGSRLVAELAAAALAAAVSIASLTTAPRIWDCCAAPGGKTLVLADRLPHAHILATDISAKRLARTAQRIVSTPHAARIRCEVIDATQPSFPSGPQSNTALFDLILCDAPCSGTGTLARNPEIRHRLQPEDLPRQAARQIAILRGALTQLAPGGRLLYSTCSLEPEENAHVIETVLRESPDTIKLLPIGPLLTSLAHAGILPADTATALTQTAIRDPYLRTLPGIHPCDGFFAALLERATV